MVLFFESIWQWTDDSIKICDRACGMNRTFERRVHGGVTKEIKKRGVSPPAASRDERRGSSQCTRVLVARASVVPSRRRLASEPGSPGVKCRRERGEKKLQGRK